MKRMIGLGPLVATVLLVAASHAASAQTTPASGGPVSATVIEDLVAANRILVAEGVLDAYDHVSIRHPSNPSRYLLSRSLAPILVTADDIIASISTRFLLMQTDAPAFWNASSTAKFTRPGRTWRP